MSWLLSSFYFICLLQSAFRVRSLLPRLNAREPSLRGQYSLSRLTNGFKLFINKGGSSVETEFQGYNGFVRHNPLSDKFGVREFHHVEFYCGDAQNAYRRFMHGLGMALLAKSDLSTGNSQHSSYCLRSGNLNMVFTAPLPNVELYNPYEGNKVADTQGIEWNASVEDEKAMPFPNFDIDSCHAFFQKHGMGIKAVAIEVDNVSEAFDTMIANGGKAVLAPTTISDGIGLGNVDLAELQLYGDVILRLLNTDEYTGDFLPNFQNVPPSSNFKTYGLERFDHIVGNVWSLEPVISNLMEMTGFHTFAEFVADDVGTVDSGLNSVVLACNNEKVLLPLNEPTFGTRKKSQIQTYLEQNCGEGVQHMALFTSDIFETIRQIRNAGSFEFMDAQPKSYYKKLASRIGKDALTEDQLRQVEELGLLVDRDDQGILIQVFTKPVGDRPTLFLEVIQRLGCDTPGCGGFGKGNFKDLFKSIEQYEDTLRV